MIVAVRFAILVVRMDQQDRATRSAGQRPRLQVDRIAEFFDRAADFLTGFRTDILFVVEYSRDRDARHPGRFRDIVDRELALGHGT